MYKQVKITRKLFKYYFKTIQIILMVYTYLQKKKKDHPSSIALISTICKAKTLKKANKANQSKLNYVTNEKILGEIKSDMANKVNIETTCNNSLGDDLIQFEDAILADVIVDHLISKLNILKDSISISKSSYGLLVKDFYPQMYQQKKKLISKYINAIDQQDQKEQSVCFYAFEIIFLKTFFKKTFFLFIYRNL